MELESNVSEQETSSSVIVDDQGRFFVDQNGIYLGEFVLTLDINLPEGAIEVPYPPDSGDQVWTLPDGPYGESRALATTRENTWREAEVLIIFRQLEAIEEAVAAEEEGEDPPEDLLPGTRNQWLSYRTKVRAWKEGNTNFPFGARPTRPT